jgi:D-3-phosphoglycerate dehydrogenase
MLVVHLPLTPETTGLIGEAELQAMKPDARVINTARGGIVDEEALYTALSEGWIAGAALDVFTEEPMTDSKLFSLENIVVTPHLGASTSEAQDKAGRMVADAVRLALEGEVVPSAVNLQVGAGVPDAVKPFVGLSEKLGRLLTALHQGQASQLQCEYVGKIADEETQALTLSAIKGLLADVVHEPLTFVNAPLLAEERGLHVSTLTSRDSRDYVSLVRMRTGDVEVAATVVGANNRERLVRVWGFDIDAEPSDHMIFFRYADRPGIIGTIGNILGEADVNIAAMQVSRQNAGGEALIVMSVDTAIPSETVNALTEAISATEVRTLNLV